MTTTTKLPKGFEIYALPKGEVQTRKNRFTGETCKLNQVEAMIFDVIMLSDYYASLHKDVYCADAQFFYDKVRAGCSWFREHNASAYMVLLD